MKKKFKINSNIYLNATESKAYIYLKKKMWKEIGELDDIDDSKIKQIHKPDFITKKGKEYEIKRLQINTYNKKYIVFTRYQFNNFKDTCMVLIFEPYKNEPFLTHNMKYIRNGKLKYKDNINVLIQ